MRITVLALLCVVSLGSFAQRSVYGVVTNSAGEPIPGVNVLLVPSQSVANTKSGTTDGKGRYTLRDFIPGKITLTFSMDGYLERIIVWTTSDQSTRDKHDAVLYKVDENTTNEAELVAITCKVVDRQGNPLAKVKIEATVEGTPFKKETVSDASGKFTISSLKNNMAILRGSLNEYRDQIVQVRVGTEPLTFDDAETFVMATLDEAYKELGKERPKDEPMTPEEEAIEIFNMAVDPYQAGNYQSAEDIAIKAYEKNPKMVEVLKLLVSANVKLSDWKDVLRYSQEYLTITPGDTNIMAAARQAAEFTNDKKAAAEIKGQLKSAGALTTTSLWSDAIAALNANDDKTAGAILLEIQQMDPKDARVSFELGKIQVREGDFDAAIKLLKSYLKNAKPNDPYIQEAKDLILSLSE